MTTSVPQQQERPAWADAPWTLHIVSFSDGREATTFDDKLAGRAEVAKRRDVAIRPAIEVKGDKVTVTVPAGKWLFGLQGDDWPPGTVDAFNEMHSVRLESIEIDGRPVKLNPSDILTVPGHSFAVYNVYPRFNVHGQHTIVYRWRGRSANYFVIPFDVLGFPDPLGLDGRRVFVPGEIDGVTLDGAMSLSYSVTVV